MTDYVKKVEIDGVLYDIKDEECRTDLHNNYVPKTRTVNGKALNKDITLTFADTVSGDNDYVVERKSASYNTTVVTGVSGSQLTKRFCWEYAKWKSGLVEVWCRALESVPVSISYVTEASITYGVTSIVLPSAIKNLFSSKPRVYGAESLFSDVSNMAFFGSRVAVVEETNNYYLDYACVAPSSVSGSTKNIYPTVYLRSS